MIFWSIGVCGYPSIVPRSERLAGNAAEECSSTFPNSFCMSTRQAMHSGSRETSTRKAWNASATRPCFGCQAFSQSSTVRCRQRTLSRLCLSSHESKIGNPHPISRRGLGASDRGLGGYCGRRDRVPVPAVRLTARHDAYSDRPAALEDRENDNGTSHSSNADRTPGPSASPVRASPHPRRTYAVRGRYRPTMVGAGRHLPYGVHDPD